MLLMLLLGGQLGVWKVKRQGSGAADAPVGYAFRWVVGWSKVKRQGSDAADAPSWRATGCLEGETARL